MCGTRKNWRATQYTVFVQEYVELGTPSLFTLTVSGFILGTEVG